MLPDPARAFIDDEHPYGHLVTLDEDGSPHVTVAWFGTEGDDLVMGTLFDQRKLANLRRDPRAVVSFQSDHIQPPGLLRYLVVHGAAEVTEGGAPQLLQRLARGYLGPDEVFPPMPDPPPGFTTRIRVERVGGVGPWAP